MSESPEVAIYVTITQEYSWNGPVSELPAAVRKGAIKRGVLDIDVLTDNVDDHNVAVALQKFMVKDGSLEDEQFEVTEIVE